MHHYLKESCQSLSYGRRFCATLLLTIGLLSPPHTNATGIWIPVTNSAPNTIDTMLLLPDGTVMAADGYNTQNAWYRLTPDNTGSYANGTWTTLASMNYTRLYYSSQVLTNGNVFIAGGEYGSGSNSAEIYNPQANTWTVLPPPPVGQVRFHDSISEMIPPGNVLISPVTPATYGGTVIYNVASNLFVPGPTLANNQYYQDEASWMKLADGSILAIDPFGTNSERYIPSLNKWVSDTNVPVPIYDSSSGEMGPAFLLPNGNAIFAGGTGNTAVYTPSGTTNVGSWAAGPVLPNSMVIADAPGAMMVNGKILYAMSPTVYDNNTYFYEYDPVANSFTGVDTPDGAPPYGQTSFALRMLNLPDGTILFSATTATPSIYVPDGTPLAAGRPTIKSLTKNADGSYHLTGTLFNGISEGSAYGDDAQMNSNYPLVRMTNGVCQVYYARTYNWSSTGVMTGTNIVSTEFAVPANVPYGIYSLVVTANGNASAPTNFIYSIDPLLVGATNTLLFTGTNGGPFTPSSVSFTLTNVGVSSLNWSIGNTSSWLHVSSSSGLLTPGGAATTVTASLTANANTLPFGTYNATLWFTNLSNHFVQSEQFTLVAYPSQLVQNGGFETGDFTDWTQSGFDGNEFVYNDPSYAHSGSNCCLFQPPGIYYQSQSIYTTPGQVYLVSFWMLNYFNNSPSQFLANWAGTNLVNLNPVPLTDAVWSNMLYYVTAKTTNSVLQFGVQYAGSGGQYLGLDDVGVTAVQVPAFKSVSTSRGSVTMTWSAMYGQTYQMQYTVSLSNPVWINLDGPVTAGNSTVTATDYLPTDPIRFYRLALVPP